MTAAEFVEQTKNWTVRLQIEKKDSKKKWSKGVEWKPEVEFRYEKAKKVIGYAIFESGERILWHEIFPLPLVLPPAGGAVFIKMTTLNFTVDGMTKTVEQVLWEYENSKFLGGKKLRSIDDQ